MPETVESYGFSVLVRSRLEFLPEFAPEDDNQVRHLADDFAERLRAFFALKTGARVQFTTVDAKYGSALTGHYGNFSFDRVEEWQQWMQLFFDFSDQVERWIEQEWTLSQHGLLLAAEVSVVPRSHRGSSPPNQTPGVSVGPSVLKQHRRQLYIMLGTALGVGIICGGMGALAYAAYDEVRRDLDQLHVRPIEIVEEAQPPVSVVVTYPPDQNGPGVVQQRPPACPSCPVVRRVPSQ